MNYKIAIPSLSRSKELKQKTLSILENHNIDKSLITVFVVEEEYEEYKNTLPDYNIVIGKRGIVQQREFIENYYPAEIQIVSFDDDITEIDLDTFENLNNFIIFAFQQCLERKSYIWSVYPVFNKFFRINKEDISTSLNFCIGTFYGYINRPNAPDLKIQFTENKDDVERSLKYFIKDGIVLRFNKVGFKTKFYSPGGLGILKERKEKIILETKLLQQHFNEYGNIKVRKNGIYEFVLKKIPAKKIKQHEVQQLPFLCPSYLSCIYEMLENISISLKNKTNNRRGFPNHRSVVFGITKGRYNGIIALSAYTKKYPEIYKELLHIGKLICPFEFNSIYVNKNVICPPHKDDKNVGNSLLISFGDYSGCNIVIDGIKYDANCRPIIFNGSQLEHYNTNDLIGTKYSLIYFNTYFQQDK